MKKKTKSVSSSSNNNKIRDLGWGTKLKKGLVLRGDLSFKDGAKYSGALKSYKKQVPHGYGIFFYAEHGKKITYDGIELVTIKYYSGNFKNGKKEGKGKFICTGQYTYEGQWKNDRLNGRGILKVWGTDEVFDGYFKDDLKIKGTWTISKKEKFIGKFKNNLPHGKGKLFEENNIYTGDFYNGEKHGHGVSVLREKKGKIFYKGQWKNNKITGKGFFDFGDGGNYKGSFLNGERHGKGVLTESKGEKAGTSFSGNWKDDNMEGIFIVKNKKGKKTKELYKKNIFIKYIK